MRVNFEIDTIKIMTEELRKSLSNEIEPASIAVKLSLLKSAVKNTDRTERLFNKCLTPDE
jgi:hypothetical protein|tara:strand:- start:2016 stop:2195 length:180 start_codon:yes stop_codon:yes gene_type:complete